MSKKPGPMSLGKSTKSSSLSAKIGTDLRFARRCLAGSATAIGTFMMSIAGEPGGGPIRAGASFIDMTTGILAYAGASSALYARASGQAGGQHVKVSRFETGMALLGYHLVDAAATGRQPDGVVTATGEGVDAIIDEIVERTPAVVDAVAAKLPDRFPARVAEPILEGVRAAAGRLGSTIPPTG